MASHTGRYVVSFNGEIYNHLELREQLAAAGAAPVWRGHSDTETLLAAIEHWGLRQTLTKSIGMFAIAVWDRTERRLWLARDRFGEKPLYYGWTSSATRPVFLFASELKALRAYPGFDNAVCRRAVTQFLRFSVIPAPRSIHRGIFKLEPSCLLRIDGPPPATAPEEPLRPGERYQSISIERWWSLGEVVARASRDPIRDEQEAVSMLEASLSEAVKAQSLADVPLGAFLSGGVDSSAIAAMMQRQASQPVRTFTVGFEEVAYDESRHARAVAEHLGTQHTELFVSAAEARAVIPSLPSMYDEPFADSSQIPTYLVCRAARQHVTVALSGDAGDEVFGGYNRYIWGPRIWNRLSWMPYQARQALGGVIARVPVSAWNAVGRSANAVLPGAHGVAHVGHKMHKLASKLKHARSLDDLYLGLVSEWEDPASLVQSADPLEEPRSTLHDPLPEAGVNEPELRMMYRDSMTYLPDDILCKVDRAAMATSLETRVPYLDPRVVELAWRLPLGMRIREQQGKWALRQLLYRHVPPALIERPKSGFGIPVGEWIRGPLRPWAESLLSTDRLKADAMFRPEPIRQRWKEHVSGVRDHTSSIWTVLMFQAWITENRCHP
ncbi:asparagine synthase (glutamine-hydrolyzing) [Ramlibacter monticola]